MIYADELNVMYPCQLQRWLKEETPIFQIGITKEDLYELISPWGFWELFHDTEPDFDIDLIDDMTWDSLLTAGIDLLNDND